MNNPLHQSDSNTVGQRLVYPYAINKFPPSLESEMHAPPIPCSAHNGSRTHRLTCQLFVFLHIVIVWIVNIMLLGFPVYLRSQGRAICEEAKRCKEPYNEWVNAMVGTVGDMLPPIFMARITINGRRCATSPPRGIPGAVVQFMHSWTSYVAHRDAEWTFLFLPIFLVLIGYVSF